VDADRDEKEIAGKVVATRKRLVRAASSKVGGGYERRLSGSGTTLTRTA
jgi:hypothetical protein